MREDNNEIETINGKLKEMLSSSLSSSSHIEDSESVTSSFVGDGQEPVTDYPTNLGNFIK